MSLLSWARSGTGLALQIAGVVCVSIGFGLINVADGFIAGGLGLIALGVAAELGAE